MASLYYARIIISVKVKSGFTIVELMVVVVVIAILAVVSVLTYNGVTKNAREVAVKSDLSSTVDSFDVEQIKYGGKYDPKSSEFLYRETQNASIEYSYGTSDSYCITASSKSDPSIVFHMTGGEDDAPLESDVCPTPNYSTTYRCVVGKIYATYTYTNTSAERLV